MNILKEHAKFIDLYPAEVTLGILASKFEYVSHTLNCKKIPTIGSVCRKSSTINPADNLKIKKLIFHRNGRVSIKTNKDLYFQFLNL